VTADEYLTGVERELCGGRAARGRLLQELRDHIDDAFAAGVDDPVERLGSPAGVVTAWRAHVRVTRARTRRRAALLALTVATTGALGVVQHASGHRPPHPSCAANAAAAARDDCDAGTAPRR
jgi:uncharacterized membrane protein